MLYYLLHFYYCTKYIFIVLAGLKELKKIICTEQSSG